MIMVRTALKIGHNYVVLNLYSPESVLQIHKRLQPCPPSEMVPVNGDVVGSG